jgi:hypothetical protein
MSSDDLHCNPAAKLGGVVNSDHRIGIPHQDAVHPHFIFQELADTWSVLENPFHMSDEPGTGETLGSAFVEQLLEEDIHSFLIKVAIAELHILPASYLQLTGSLSTDDVDSSSL